MVVVLPPQSACILRRISKICAGAVYKWRHPLKGGGGSAKRWRYSISPFSKIGDKEEGGVKNL